MKKTQNVHVEERPRKERAPKAHASTSRKRRWNLTDEQLDQAETLARAIVDGIGQSENQRSYFVCAAEALEANQSDAVFAAIALTREEMQSNRIRTTPSQYFHHTLWRLLRRSKGRTIDRSALL